MLNIKNIQELVGIEWSSLGLSTWKITKVNEDSSDNYYGIVIREQITTGGDYVVLYLCKNKREDGTYEMSSNKSSIIRPITIGTIRDIDTFAGILFLETKRILNR